MHRLGFSRGSLGVGTSGIRPRPTVSHAAASARNAFSSMVKSITAGSNLPEVSSNRCLSTSTNSKYKDIPKRVYQSAPKRSHGKHAGMKKWSGVQKSPAAVATPQAAEGEGEEADEGEKQLALGKVGGSRKAEDLREVKTGLKEIRVSPWSLNLLAKLVRGLPVVEAAAQLKFCRKKHTITVSKAIQVGLVLARFLRGPLVVAAACALVCVWTGFYLSNPAEVDTRRMRFSPIGNLRRKCCSVHTTDRLDTLLDPNIQARQGLVAFEEPRPWRSPLSMCSRCSARRRDSEKV